MQIIKTFNFIKGNISKFILLMFLELLFFSFLAIILVFSSAKLAENYDILSSQGEIDTSKFLNAENEDLINLQEKLSLVDNSLNNIIRWYWITLIILILIYGFFRSVQWLISYNIIEKKKLRFNFKYFYKFYFLLLIWVVISVLLLIILNFIFESEYFLLLILFLFYVLSSISFVLLLKENKILGCIKKSFKLLFSKNILIFLFIILVFGISIFILSLLTNITFLSLFISILSLLWILFLVTYSRIFILLNLE